MRWHTGIIFQGEGVMAQCRGYVWTHEERFTASTKRTRESLLARARRDAGMGPERLLSKLYRWHLESRGHVGIDCPINVPTLVKYSANV